MRIDPSQYHRQFITAVHTAGFRIIDYGPAPDGIPLLVAEHTPPQPLLSLYLSAGIHGDEPAGPLALCKLMEHRWFDLQIAWHIHPLLNPRGTAARTRETPDGIDLNRDYHHATAPETRAHKTWLAQHHRHYHAAISLHEDWESTGFYLYEIHDPDTAPLGWSILQTVEPLLGLDHATEIDGFPARNGYLNPDADASLASNPHWPEQLWLRRHHTPTSLTFETPTSAPLPTRILAHIIALQNALAQLLAPRLNDTFDI